MIRLLSLILFTLSLSSCKRVVLVVDKVPSNTPPGTRIYAGGNFNFWDGGDRRFEFVKTERGLVAELPIGWGRAEYKLTRGDWTSAEGDRCGHEINNRLVDYLKVDTQYISIESWQDIGPTQCDQVVLRIRRKPRETPKGAMFFAAGNFNIWRIGDPKYRFIADARGNLVTRVETGNAPLQLKINRGDLSNVEVGVDGKPFALRSIPTGRQDTIDLEVAGWNDITPTTAAGRITILARVPTSTPPEDTLYLAGTFNDWNPKDRRYAFSRMGRSSWIITLDKPEGAIEYKITRGSWPLEETDPYGNIPSNYRLRSAKDTVIHQISTWADRPDLVGRINQGGAPPPTPDIKVLPPSPPIELFVPSSPDPNNPEREPTGPMVSFIVVNTSFVSRQIFVRLELPSQPGNRNYGFAQRIWRNSQPVIVPIGTKVYACDGPYWDNNRHKERLVTVIIKQDNGRILEAKDLQYSGLSLKDIF